MMRFSLVTAVVCFAFAAACGEELKHGEDSEIHEGTPRGKVEKQPAWESKIFPGTKRDWWIYVPAQYDAATPANVMIFQDGGGPIGEKGEMRAPIVFDNLIAKKQMPVTISIFINPGTLGATDKGQLPRQNRSFEYDSVTDGYARFLVEEILPEVEKKYKLTHDPAGRGLCGQSSGGSCAFTAAWFRPDVFGKVVSGIGSFTSLHGGNVFPDLIRKTEPKPIRVYMQDGDRDLDIYAGSWWHANMDIAAALRWSGYDYHFLQGHDGHSGKQLGVNFPDAMRWLWRNEPVQGKRPDKVDNRGVFEVLVNGEGWKKAADLEANHVAIRAAADDAGVLHFIDLKRLDGKRGEEGSVRKLGADGKISNITALNNARHLAFTPGGKLIVGTATELFTVGDDGALIAKAKAENEISTLAVNHKGEVYCAIPSLNTVRIYDADLKARDVAYAKIGYPELAQYLAFCFTPDQGFLVAASYNTWEMQSARVEADGALAHAEPFYTLQALEGQQGPNVSSLAVDEKGRLYASSINGVQIFDQGGRVIGILVAPSAERIQGIAFGGANFDTLYAVTSKAIYARKLNAKGVRSSKPPVMPPPPRM